MWSEVKLTRPRFLPPSRLPDSIDALAAFCELPVDARVLRDARVTSTKWGKACTPHELRPALEALHQRALDGDAVAEASAVVQAAVDAVVRRLERLDRCHVPVLDKAKDRFCREAIYGGRTEAYEKLFELTRSGGASVRDAKRVPTTELQWEIAYIDAKTRSTPPRCSSATCRAAPATGSRPPSSRTPTPTPNPSSAPSSASSRWT